jgi:DNA-binding NtrC family response regulator
MHYDFPGNVRELKSIVQAAINLGQGAGISARFLPKHLCKQFEKGPVRIDKKEREIEPLARVEKRHILLAYRHTGENKSETARLLGVSLSTLRRRLESYGVE